MRRGRAWSRPQAASPDEVDATQDAPWRLIALDECMHLGRLDDRGRAWPACRESLARITSTGTGTSNIIAVQMIQFALSAPPLVAPENSQPRQQVEEERIHQKRVKFEQTDARERERREARDEA
ncbi:hypothetical protein CDD83_379 [Cordyceps sp. RAO-2017]|nr:hypothetical protein CDD83_379 [Cordyceps sp. RAO-2017]